jgi:nitroimidazol reductase NimA-like FMN-containing flavoprotein (pyridoxamine 5'-phosphate oxidase superfamily)
VSTVGRVGFVSPAGLQIIPVNYRLGAGHRLFFKTAPRGALAQLSERDAQVAFEVDFHAADFRIA